MKVLTGVVVLALLSGTASAQWGGVVDGPASQYRQEQMMRDARREAREDRQRSFEAQQDRSAEDRARLRQDVQEGMRARDPARRPDGR